MNEIRYVELENKKALSEKVTLVGEIRAHVGNLTYVLPILRSSNGKFLSRDKLTGEEILRLKTEKQWQMLKFVANLDKERKFTVPGIGEVRVYAGDSQLPEIRVTEKCKDFWKVLKEADI